MFTLHCISPSSKGNALARTPDGASCVHNEILITDTCKDATCRFPKAACLPRSDALCYLQFICNSFLSPLSFCKDRFHCLAEHFSHNPLIQHRRPEHPNALGGFDKETVRMCVGFYFYPLLLFVLLLVRYGRCTHVYTTFP